MKKSFQPKLIVIAVFILFAIAVVITNSCRKDIHNAGNNGTINSNSIIDTSVVTQARKWYQAAYPESSPAKVVSQSISNSAAQHWDQVLTPYWAKAQAFIQDSLLIIEIPALKKGDLAFSNKQVSANSFDFTKSPSVTSILIVVANGHIGAYAMTIMGDSSYIANNYNKLSNNTYRKKDNNFSGYVFYNEMNGTFVNGWRYANGKVVGAIKQQQTTSSTNPSQGTQSIKKVNVEEAPPTNCYEDVTEYWEVCTYWENDTFYQNPISCSYYTTDNIYSIPCPGTSGGGGGDGSEDGNISPPTPQVCQTPNVTEESINGRIKIDVAPPPPGGSGSTGSTGTTPPSTSQSTCEAVNTITDSVTNPCLKSIINNLTNNQTLQTDITGILRNTFGVNDVVNITYDQATLTGNDATDDAKTDGQNSNLYVTFNTPEIANASQEYLLETTMHETIHAYLDINQSVYQGFTQHTYMIQNYVSAEVATLQKVYSSLSTHDAECLVLAGYATLNPTVLNSVLASYNLTLNDVATTNDSYKNGTKGTKC